MQPMRMRVDRVIDFGTIVSLVGIDLETARPVTVHVDHRPFAESGRHGTTPASRIRSNTTLTAARSASTFSPS
jgi:hypothetical protein